MKSTEKSNKKIFHNLSTSMNDIRNIFRSKKKRKNKFDLSFTSKDFAPYNALTDKNLTEHFAKEKVKRHLRRMRLINRSGFICNKLSNMGITGYLSKFRIGTKPLISIYTLPPVSKSSNGKRNHSFHNSMNIQNTHQKKKNVTSMASPYIHSKERYQKIPEINNNSSNRQYLKNLSKTKPLSSLGLKQLIDKYVNNNIYHSKIYK